MIKNMKKVMTAILLITISMILSACTQPGGSTGDGTKPKVALLLSGYIADGGFSQSAYEGFVKAEKDLDFEGAFTESILLPDMESVMNNYATTGYDVIIAVGFAFSETLLKVAPNHPDVRFVTVNGSAAQEPNLAFYRTITAESGFLAGAFSAMVSESGKIGMVNGKPQPPVIEGEKGYIAGAKYINPNIDVQVIYTDSFTDVPKANEAALSLIENGVDVMTCNVGTGSLGVIDAAKKNDKLVTGFIGDQYKMAPGTVPFSAIQDIGQATYLGIESALSDEFKAERVLVGSKEGVIRPSDFHEIGNKPVSDEIKNKIEEIYQDLVDGKFNNLMPEIK